MPRARTYVCPGFVKYRRGPHRSGHQRPDAGGKTAVVSHSGKARARLRTARRTIPDTGGLVGNCGRRVRGRGDCRKLSLVSDELPISRRPGQEDSPRAARLQDKAPMYFPSRARTAVPSTGQPPTARTLWRHVTVVTQSVRSAAGHRPSSASRNRSAHSDEAAGFPSASVRILRNGQSVSPRGSGTARSAE